MHFEMWESGRNWVPQIFRDTFVHTPMCERAISQASEFGAMLQQHGKWNVVISSPSARGRAARAEPPLPPPPLQDSQSV